MYILYTCIRYNHATVLMHRRLVAVIKVLTLKHQAGEKIVTTLDTGCET